MCLEIEFLELIFLTQILVRGIFNPSILFEAPTSPPQSPSPLKINAQEPHNEQAPSSPPRRNRPVNSAVPLTPHQLTKPPSAHKEWEALSSIAELIEPQARSREEFIAECKNGAFDKVVVAYRTFQSVAITGLVDEELVAALPEKLKFIAHNGIFIPFLRKRRDWEMGIRIWLIESRSWIRSDRRTRLHREGNTGQ